MDRLSAWTQSLGLNREGLTSAITFVKNVALLNVAGDMESGFDDGLVKITDNIYSMGYPCADDSVANGSVPLSAMSARLRSTFPSKFMIWNLSDRTYDYSMFDDQVIEFKLPGYTSPPLDKIFAICRSIDGWLQGDPKNVAIIHCINGRGRTIVTIACYLMWIGAFPSTKEAIDYVLSVQNAGIQHLIPSQERYLNYFDRIISKDYPSVAPLHLERIIINTLPVVEADGSCRPYIQIFKYGKLLKSTASKVADITSYKSKDSVSFAINIDLEGDILIRLRHFSKEGVRISLLRFTFHTGYIKDYSFRCVKTDLDGAYKDDRFSPEFHIDLVFSEAKNTNSKPALSPDFFSQISQRQVITPDAIRQRVSASADDEKNAQTDYPNDVEALISGLGIEGDLDNLDDDTDELLAQLQEEIQGENGTSDNRQETIERSKESELDAEISELLASS